MWKENKNMALIAENVPYSSVPYLHIRKIHA